MTDAQEQGEDIFAAAADFGEAVEITLRRRSIEPDPTLSLIEVDNSLRAIAAITGRSSRGRKLAALRELFERASALEGKYLAKILIGEMRHGMSEGLLLEAIARMLSRPVAEVRRAHQLEPDVGRLVLRLRAPAAPVTATPNGGDAPLEEAARVSRAASSSAMQAGTPKPLRPMLAAPVANIAEAFRILDGNLALEHKLDGARVQIHCDDRHVRIFSRRLNDITPSLPEVVEMMARLGSRRAGVDGEVIAVDATGRAIAFQELMRRFGRTRDIERSRAEQPVRLFLFDLMSLDDGWLIDLPYADRYAALKELAKDAGLELAGRILPASVVEGQQFYARAIGEGYEGVMAKGLDSHYTPGARGRGWLKIKTARTFDLVIVAAEWGYGTAPRLALQLPSGRARSGYGWLCRGRQNLQGADGCGLSGDDGAAARAEDRRGARHRSRASRGRRRGCLQRYPAQSALCRWDGAAIRPDHRGTFRQEPGRSRYD